MAGKDITNFPDLKADGGLGTFSMTTFDRVNPFYTDDGINSHRGFSLFGTERLTLTSYACEMEELALSVNIQWTLRDCNEE